MVYPDFVHDFSKKLMDRPDMNIFEIPAMQAIDTKEDFDAKASTTCGQNIFEKAMYQHFVEHYLSVRSPYRSLLLYHGVGVGKSCTSITVAESLLKDDFEDVDLGKLAKPKVLVILSKALQRQYEEQIFHVTQSLDYDTLMQQCTGNTYLSMIHGIQKTSDHTTITRKVRSIIKQRYEFVTYDGLIAMAADPTLSPLRNRVIIVDEAHNLRNDGSSNTDSAAGEALIELVKKGENNRLLLLTATPMYNDANEIWWLLYVLALNDKRPSAILNKDSLPSFINKDKSISKTAFEKLEKLAGQYVSYLRGANPFAIAVRVSASTNGFRIMTNAPPKAFNGRPTPLEDRQWTKLLPEELLPTELGKFQHEYLTTPKAADAKQTNKNKEILIRTLQANNVVYPISTDVRRGGAANSKALGNKKFMVGEKGFDSTFVQLDDNATYPVKYINASMQILSPKHAPGYACKIHRVLDILENSTGPVIVYSQYVRSGVVPLAIAMEHRGYKRHNLRALCQNATVDTSYAATPKRKGITWNYAIISGNSSVNGMSMEDVRRTFNSPQNKDGKLIKALLLTPVAGEGLSFQNVREIHILDPWYHMNKVEQVVGRAIRTCSHKSLPLEQRNVSVYLHVTTNPGVTKGENSRETADQHAYHIAASKYNITAMAETVLQNNAIDCSLQRNANYYAKDLFHFQVKLQTSQGKYIEHQFGDEEGKRPNCSVNVAVAASTSNQLHPLHRYEDYEKLLPTLSQRIRKYMTQQFLNGKRTVLVHELIGLSNKQPLFQAAYLEALDRTINNEEFSNVFIVKEHKDILLLIPKVELNKQRKEVRVSIPLEVRDDVQDSLHGQGIDILMDPCIQSLDKTDVSKATIQLYSCMTKSLFDSIINTIFAGKDTPGQVLNIFTKTGVLILSKELTQSYLTTKRTGTTKPDSPIGYIQIFSSNHDMMLMSSDGGMRLATAKEKEELLKGRQSIDGLVRLGRQRMKGVPQKAVHYGLFEEKMGSDLPGGGSMEFKVVDPGNIQFASTDKNRQKKGMVCKSKNIPTIDKVLKELDPITHVSTYIQSLKKEDKCSLLALELYKKNSLYLPPFLFPKN